VTLTPTPVVLTLESGFEWEGLGWGDFSKARGAELVFNTAMTGIEESLTDPSFFRQTLVSTVSHVGNTGYVGEDQESSKIWAEGLICRHLEPRPIHWRAKSSLASWIVSQGRFVVEGVHTRSLVTTLREQGSQRAVIWSRNVFNNTEQALDFLKNRIPSMVGADLASQVSTSKAWEMPPQHEFGYWPYATLFEPVVAERPRQVAVWDFGVKSNSLRILSAMGVHLHILPATAKADEILQAGVDGVLLSNGPGDPAAATHIIGELKKVLGRKKLFAVCLGHQLVALAAGAKTYKMKFGHRGIHHPVTELDAGRNPLRTWITSQNHGFAVDEDSLPKSAEVSFRHCDDLSNEGVRYLNFDLPCETVQFHPEAAPGPMDAHVLLKNFVRTLGT
jgi:carbamoyl-phosphate synthase small subunit